MAACGPEFGRPHSNVRLTRHAKNRLRLIARRAPAVTERWLLEALASAALAGTDVKGNRKFSVRIDAILLTAVVDQERQVVVTLWREE